MVERATRVHEVALAATEDHRMNRIKKEIIVEWDMEALSQKQCQIPILTADRLSCVTVEQRQCKGLFKRKAPTGEGSFSPAASREKTSVGFLSGQITYHLVM